ncbi:stabilizer of axonemal microtubules 4 isoform X3 [Danio rerio]|uniref:Stabilizer of axonemal microtubules 4 isoform X3 n=3 Tax=Danio rerio TaxID=7955 RepID=A0AC58IWU1_DANRE
MGRDILPTTVPFCTTAPGWMTMIIHSLVSHCWTVLSLSRSAITSVWFSPTGRSLWPARDPDAERADICSYNLSQDLEQRHVRLNIKALTFLTALELWDDARRTQESVMRTDFLAGSFLQGREAFPKLASHSNRETGFTRDTNRPLTSSTSLQHGISQDNRQKTRPNVATLSIGPVGSSGFVLNAPNITRLSQTPADPQHFLTHYQSKFYNKSLTEQQRSDWMRGGIQKHRKSGYSGRDTDRFNLSGY